MNTTRSKGRATLTSANVNEVAKRCLFTDEELLVPGVAPEGAIIVEGIVNRYAFHPDRLGASTAEIAAMLDCLDDAFKTDGGGGMSFLNACVTKDGEHWGEHPTMGMLFALGIGAGLAKYTMPREMWSVLPGSVPYITVDSAALRKASEG